MLPAAEEESTAPQVPPPTPCLPAAPSPSIHFSALGAVRQIGTAHIGVCFSPQGQWGRVAGWLLCEAQLGCRAHTPPKWVSCKESPEGKGSDSLGEAVGSPSQTTAPSNFLCLLNPSCPPTSPKNVITSMPFLETMTFLLHLLSKKLLPQTTWPCDLLLNHTPAKK